MPSIAQTIRDEFMEPNETINSFIRRHDLKYNAIFNLLTDRSKNPAEKTIRLLAERLGTTPEYLRYKVGPKTAPTDGKEA